MFMLWFFDWFWIISKERLSFRDGPLSIRATGFDSEPYLLASLPSNNPYLSDSNQEDGKHQLGPKTRITSLYFYAKSQNDQQDALSSLAVHVSKESERVDDEQPCAVRVRVTERNLERLSQSEDDWPH